MSEALTSKAEILSQIGEYLTAPKLPLENAEQVAGGLIDLYDDPKRAYHNLSHLGHMVMFLAEHSGELHNPRRVFWATIGHDAIYIPRLYMLHLPLGLNEEFSAQITQSSLQTYLPYKEVAQIGDDIRATAAHNLGRASSDRAYVLDADQSILGSQPSEFDKYDEAIKKEFEFVGPRLFRAARLGILKNFLVAKHVFHTDIGRELFQAQAQENIERKIIEYEANLA